MAGFDAKLSKNERQLLALLEKKARAALVVSGIAAKIRVKSEQVQAEKRKKERQIVKFGAPVVARAGRTCKYGAWCQHCIYRSLGRAGGVKHIEALRSKTQRRLRVSGGEAFLSQYR